MDDLAPAPMMVDMTERAAGAEKLVDDAAPSSSSDDAAQVSSSDVVIIPSEDEAENPLPPNAVLQPDGSVILTLRQPVVLKWQREGSDDVREEARETLHMRRLTGADMRAVMSAGQGHAVTTGIAKSCRMQQGVFNKLFDKMDGADAAAAAQVFSFFLDGGAPKATGQPNSPA